MQSRTHTCGELRIEDIGKKVQLAGWMENVREVGGSLAFVVVRDFYGTTQLVVQDEALLRQIRQINKESTIQVTGTVRERSSKNPKLPTGEIEVVPESITVLGKCRYNELPFEINRSREADETQRLRYRYLDLRNPAVKKNIILRCEVVAALRSAMIGHGFLEITTPILTKFAEAGCFDRVCVMIQKEVAERICAGPGTKDYGAFGLFVQWHYEPEFLFTVPPHCFMPQPKVVSAAVRLTKRPEPPFKVSDEELLFRVIRAAFNQRRKTLTNALRSAISELGKADCETILNLCNFETNIRGEMLNLGDFAKISNELDKFIQNDL